MRIESLSVGTMTVQTPRGIEMLESVALKHLPQKTILSEQDKPLNNNPIVLYWEVSDKSRIGWRFGMKWFVIEDGHIVQVSTPSHFREILR